MKYFMDFDGDSKWYMIPLELRKQWNNLVLWSKLDHAEIDKQFGKYRINHPSDWVFSDPFECD